MYIYMGKRMWVFCADERISVHFEDVSEDYSCTVWLVVTWKSQNFHQQKFLMPTVDMGVFPIEGRGQQHCRSPASFLSTSNNWYYHLADGVFVINTCTCILYHAICPGFFAGVAEEIKRD